MKPAQSINFSVPLVSTPPVSTESTCEITEQNLDHPRAFALLASRGNTDGVMVDTLVSVQNKSTQLIPRQCHSTTVQIVNGTDVYREVGADGTTRELSVPRTQVLSTVVANDVPNRPIQKGPRGMMAKATSTAVKTTNPGEFRMLQGGNAKTAPVATAGGAASAGKTTTQTAGGASNKIPATSTAQNKIAVSQSNKTAGVAPPAKVATTARNGGDGIQLPNAEKQLAKVSYISNADIPLIMNAHTQEELPQSRKLQEEISRPEYQNLVVYARNDPKGYGVGLDEHRKQVQKWEPRYLVYYAFDQKDPMHKIWLSYLYYLIEVNWRLSVAYPENHVFDFRPDSTTIAMLETGIKCTMRQLELKNPVGVDYAEIFKGFHDKQTMDAYLFHYATLANPRQGDDASDRAIRSPIRSARYMEPNEGKYTGINNGVAILSGRQFEQKAFRALITLIAMMGRDLSVFLAENPDVEGSIPTRMVNLIRKPSWGETSDAETWPALAVLEDGFLSALAFLQLGMGQTWILAASFYQSLEPGTLTYFTPSLKTYLKQYNSTYPEELGIQMLPAQRRLLLEAMRAREGFHMASATPYKNFKPLTEVTTTGELGLPKQRNDGMFVGENSNPASRTVRKDVPPEFGTPYPDIDLTEREPVFRAPLGVFKKKTPPPAAAAAQRRFTMKRRSRRTF